VASRGGAAAVNINFTNTGAFTAGKVTLQGSNDGISWIAVPSTQIYQQQQGGPLGLGVITLTASSQQYIVIMAGFTALRLLLNVAITSTGQTTPYVTALPYSPFQVIAGLGSGGITPLSQDPNGNVFTVLSPSTTVSAACSTKDVTALTVSNIKTSAGNVYGMSIVNNSAATLYIQLYNTAGTPTLGTSVVSWIAVPASGVLTISPGAVALEFFATGIGIGASTTPTSTGTPTTAPSVAVWYL